MIQIASFVSLLGVSNQPHINLDQPRLNPRSWGASTPMKMCIQAVLDDTGALRHMNKSNSKRPVCITHPLTPVSTCLLLLQPSMEGDNKLCKASIDAQPLGHAALTLAQSISMDYDKVLTWVQKLLSFDPSFPLFLSLFLSLSSSPYS